MDLGPIHFKGRASGLKPSWAKLDASYPFPR